MKCFGMRRAADCGGDGGGPFIVLCFIHRVGIELLLARWHILNRNFARGQQ